MPIRVLQFEDTPNPEAVRCRLSATIAAERISARTPTEAAAHPLASALFEAGASNVLIVDDWMSVTRGQGVAWPTMKRRIRGAVERFGSGGDDVP